MKSYNNLYPKLCSYKNLEKAYEKAKKNKSFISYVLEFEKNKTKNLLQLKKELETLTYKPKPLTKFIITDPKTRVIRKSDFRDRIVHHAVVLILEPIYEKIFIYDSYANRINKGTLTALKRFDEFKRKVSKNGKLINPSKDNNLVKGYALKADIKHFFDSVDQGILPNILKKKVKDKKIIWLINAVLKNFDNKIKGMPLGNMTSQFFANVYLNELDYFIKHDLKAKYYIRYVDDFVILHENKEILEIYKEKVNNFLKENLKLELHHDKSKTSSMHKGVNLLGFRVFYYYKLLRKRNIKQFKKRFIDLERQHAGGLIEYSDIIISVQGWFAYAVWGNTYNIRKEIVKKLNLIKIENTNIL